MKRILAIGTVTVMVLAFTGVAVYAEDAPKQVHDLAQTKLADLGKSTLIIAAVKEQNAKNMTLDSIKEMDEKWKKTPGIADFMKPLMETGCASNLKQIQTMNPFYAEIFVMDNQGANVCQTDKTSDYWQGDEAKFQKSFNNGNGAVFVDEVEFDDSTQSYISQVSVPVMENGKAIGAITFGIDIDKLN